jgi:hypothetical protein
MPSATLPGAANSMTADITPIIKKGMTLMVRPVQSMALDVVGVDASRIMGSPVQMDKGYPNAKAGGKITT